MRYLADLFFSRKNIGSEESCFEINVENKLFLSKSINLRLFNN